MIFFFLHEKSKDMRVTALLSVPAFDCSVSSTLRTNGSFHGYNLMMHPKLSRADKKWLHKNVVM